MADSKTATVTIDEKSYILTPLTVEEHVRTKLLGLGFNEMQRKGKISEEVATKFNQTVRAIVQTSISRADPAARIDELCEADVPTLLKKICELSIEANVLDPLTGPVQ